MALRSKYSVILALSVLFLLNVLPAQTGEIHGRISVPEPYPAPKTIKVDKKFQDSCADERLSQELLVSPEGGLENAVVWLEGDFPASAEATEKPILHQSQCGFSPHILLVPQGSSFDSTNEDPLGHDIRAFLGAEMVFRFEMDAGAKPVEKNFEKPGIYVIRCGLHPWMHAFAVKAAHPFYAVSDGQGNFVVKNVPDGKYSLKLWHESLGEAQAPVEVTGKTDFSYVFKKA